MILTPYVKFKLLGLYADLNIGYGLVDPPNTRAQFFERNTPPQDQTRMPVLTRWIFEHDLTRYTSRYGVTRLRSQ